MRKRVARRAAGRFHATGGWFAEQSLIDLAAAFERQRSWADRWPG